MSLKREHCSILCYHMKVPRISLNEPLMDIGILVAWMYACSEGYEGSKCVFVSGLTWIF